MPADTLVARLPLSLFGIEVEQGAGFLSAPGLP
jgi:hypothetical protein